MKIPFTLIVENHIRNVVIHEVLNDIDIIHKLQPKDLIFFDDCLYSQYLFLNKHNSYLKSHMMIAVIGFSTQIFRDKNQLPIEYAICSECHSQVHAGNISAYNAYMSHDEVHNLLQEDNIYLACHGAQHLELGNMNLTRQQQTNIFKADVARAAYDLSNLGLKTNIFVFPYAYDRFPFAYKILNDYGFFHIFAGHNTKRVQIENI